MIEWTPEMTNAVVNYIKQMFSDLSGLLVIIIGVGVGLIVIDAIISAIRHK